jgi:hypothetical protein
VLSLAIKVVLPRLGPRSEVGSCAMNIFQPHSNECD